MNRAKNNAGTTALRQLFLISIALVFASGMLHAATATVNYDYFWLALGIPIAIIAIGYMGSYAFNTPSLRAILQDELLQILATGAVALTLIGTQAVVDQYVVAALQGGGYNGAQNIDSALGAAALVNANITAKTVGVLSDMQDVSMVLGGNASKSVMCNFMGVGFTISNCAQLGAYRGSLTAAAFTTTVALSDAYAQGYLLSLARAYAFTILIPLGLLLRCFKASRAAGGALIAIGFGFYAVYPVVMLATDSMLHGPSPPEPPTLPSVGECDPMQTDMSAARSDFRDYGNQLTEYNQNERIASFVLVRVLFMSILNLIITLGFIRTFAQMIGSDIDVSALARIS